jgi:hypothetical protein
MGTVPITSIATKRGINESRKLSKLTSYPKSVVFSIETDLSKAVIEEVHTSRIGN